MYCIQLKCQIFTLMRYLGMTLNVIFQTLIKNMIRIWLTFKENGYNYDTSVFVFLYNSIISVKKRSYTNYSSVFAFLNSSIISVKKRSSIIITIQKARHFDITRPRLYNLVSLPAAKNRFGVLCLPQHFVILFLIDYNTSVRYTVI